MRSGAGGCPEKGKIVMRKHINTFGRIMVVTGLASLIAATGVHARIWTSLTGETVEAEYVRHVSGKIVLQKTNGKEITISPEALIKGDQEYVNKQVRPTLVVTFSKSTKSKTVSYDDTRQTLTSSVKITRTSSQPYSGELTVEAYVIGEDLATEENILLKKKVWKGIKLPEGRREVLELSLDAIDLVFDDEGPTKYGEQYYGYAIFVLDEDGKLFVSNASRKNFTERLSLFRKGNLKNL